ncbi:glycerophosphodiester phosphodiesterase [Bowmanella dokdonensis]|uniref:Glycerophosphodiester phosphodiesterase n=1 Tax=Bowmanella dokdonensis TaxID=751969 RepID=A0A939DJB5_9ALTE|nr:glycerophosphodiester phosphodiesterase family protein [Bowmanella dokdonensis]MBN7823774.1 glycerophosphodiester phosphodiesterase [Bowmanella dokdonensis]
MLVIAHRGASAVAPENTLLAMQMAINMGVDGIEIDVHEVEDEHLVIHDRWLHRTTQVRGRLTDFSLARLRELDAGQGQRIPTLWEVMQEVRGQCSLNIELKGVTHVIPILRLLDKAVQELGFDYSQLLLSSFNHHLLFEIKQIRPELLTGALTASCPLDYAAFAHTLQAFSIHIYLDFVNPAFVADAKDKGLQVYVYTVDEVEDMDMLRAWGVDGIFTNMPDRAIAHLRQPVVTQPQVPEQL